MKNFTIKFSFLLVLLVFQFAFHANATDWYIDNAATGANNGTSWTDAWQSFADIQWTSVQPGDTVFISGGTSEKLYNERLLIQDVNGTAEAPIIISVGQDPGHNGTVVIDLEFVENRWSGINITRSQHVVVTGQVRSESTPKIKVTRSSWTGVLVQQTSDNIALKYIESCFNGDRAYQSGIGFNLPQPPENMEIGYCDIHDNYQDGLSLATVNPDAVTNFDAVRVHHNKIYNIHDDGIESALWGLSIYNNEIGKRIYPHRGHPDNMQLYGNYLKIYNNYIFDWIANDINEYPDGPYLEGASNIIYICKQEINQVGSHGGHIFIYNNLIVETEPLTNSFSNNPICLAFGGADWTDVSEVYVFNNTISGDFSAGILAAFSNASTHETVHDFYIMNNNLYNATHDLAYTLALSIGDGDLDDITHGSYGTTSDIIVDYNCIYGTGTENMSGYPDNLGYNDNGLAVDPLVNLEFTQVQGEGGALIDVVINPLGNGYYKAKSADSPIVDAGFDVTILPALQNILSAQQLEELRTDRNGSIRPQGSAWDIGAYEYTTGTNINSASTENKESFRIYPNPFAYKATIEYTLPVGSDVEITLYDVTGRKVQILFKGHQIAGKHTLDVELKNIEAGVFFFKLNAGTYKAISKCIITQ